jgi:hypothetical protein
MTNTMTEVATCAIADTYDRWGYPERCPKCYNIHTNQDGTPRERYKGNVTVADAKAVEKEVRRSFSKVLRKIYGSGTKHYSDYDKAEAREAIAECQVFMNCEDFGIHPTVMWESGPDMWAYSFGESCYLWEGRNGGFDRRTGAFVMDGFEKLPEVNLPPGIHTSSERNSYSITIYKDET